ncbi:MAG: hypothetical protein ACI8ZM_002657 [Crocinitomix sp.]|jgi:hypothetical protein
MLEVIDDDLKNIYKYFIPIKLLFFLYVLIGSFILTASIYLFQNNIYPGIYTFAGPLLGAALIINGLTRSKIEEINIDFSHEIFRLRKDSLLSSKNTEIKFNDLKSELRWTNKNQFSLSSKLKMVIFNKDEKISELTSNFLGFNNNKLKKLQAHFKEIPKSSF